MPTFNRAGLIAESLRTVLTQAGEDDEILVIDDGSDDGTPEIVAAMAPRVRYVRQRNAGKSSALNHGLAMTDGAYVWICDDDDLLRSRAVAALVGALETSDAGFVFGRHNRFKIGPSGTRASLGTGYWPDLAHGGLNRHIFEDAFFLQNGMLVRRTAYESVGLFDESFLRSQDYEMFVRLATNCVGVFVDEVIFDQRLHDGDRGPNTARHAANASGDIWLQYDRRIFEKHATVLSLPLLETMFETGEPNILARAAHLQRACSLRRHRPGRNVKSQSST